MSAQEVSKYLEVIRPDLKAVLTALAEQTPSDPYKFLAAQFRSKAAAASGAAPAAEEKKEVAPVSPPEVKLSPGGKPLIEGVDVDAEITKYTTASNDVVLGKQFPPVDHLAEVSAGLGSTGAVKLYFFWAQFSKSGFKYLPMYSELAEKYVNQIQVIGVSCDPKIASPKKFMDDPAKKYSTAFKTTFRIVHDTDGKLKNAMGPLLCDTIGTPHMFMVDKTGKIVWHQNHSQIGATAPSYLDQIERQVQAVLTNTPLESNGERAEDSDEEDSDDDEEACDVDLDDLF